MNLKLEWFWMQTLIALISNFDLNRLIACSVYIYFHYDVN
jgi:hypothetical protein